MANVLRRRLKSKLKSLMGDQTQEVFSAKIGIGQGSLNRILKGNQDVGLDMLERISHYSGLSIELLIGNSITDIEKEGPAISELKETIQSENKPIAGITLDPTLPQG
jgi:transcriptional regulator with XRE-family HTH domain